MANPGGKNQYGGPYAGGSLKGAAKSVAKSAAKAASETAPATAANAGRPPRLSDAELQEMAKTPAGRAAIRKHMRAREQSISSPARLSAAASGFTGAKPKPKRTPTSRLRKPKAGAKKK